MSRNRVLIRILACAGMIFSLAACSQPPTATIVPTVPAPTATASATPAAAPTATPVVPTATATTPPPAASATPAAPLITVENAANLTSVSLSLPEWPNQLFWPGENAPLPAGLSPRPGLIARAGNNLYPLQLDPPTAGNPAPLPFSGDQSAFSPDLSTALSWSQDSAPKLYDLTGNVLATLPMTAPYGANYAPDGKMAAITSSNELAAFIYSLPDGQPVTKLTGFQTAAPVYTVGILPGDATVYWLARANFQLQDIQTGAMGAKLSYPDFIGPVAFTPDGQRLVLYVASDLYVYSVPDLKELAHLTLSEPARSLAIAPDGRLLAAGCGSKIDFFDLGEKGDSLLPVGEVSGPGEASGQVAFSPDGRFLVSVHADNILTIWKAQ